MDPITILVFIEFIKIHSYNQEGLFISTIECLFLMILDSEIALISNQYLLSGGDIESHQKSLEESTCLICLSDKGKVSFFI